MSQPQLDHLPRRIAHAAHAAGPFPFLNPTTRYVHVPAPGGGRHPDKADAADGAAAGQPAGPASAADSPDGKPHHHATHRPTALARAQMQGAYQVWRSRDNRKGRHAIVLTRDFVRHHGGGGGGGDQKSEPPATAAAAATADTLPPRSGSLRGVLRGLGAMATRAPVWDVSYDVAMLFTLGSVVWVVNSFFVWLPVAFPATAFAHEATTAGGASALVGATVFEVGAVLGVLEAVNENRTDCFGWALDEAARESGLLRLRPRPDACRHAHVARHGLLGGVRVVDVDEEDGQRKPAAASTAPTASDSDDSGRDPPPRAPPRQWSWWPSWHELRTVYAREAGFWACATQLVGATVFWISGFTGLPPVLARLSPAAADGVFWLPQVVGGVGFVLSSLLFMLETQRAWYCPAPQLLGWHIGLWNLVGAFGFTLCGALGFAAAHSDAVAYASTLSTFIGSWAFLIGSVIQWYESLDKFPLEIRDSLPRHVPL